MSYNVNIPAASSKRTISQRQILANFQAIYNSFAQNHAPLGSANQGRHIVLKLQSQAGDPATSTTETALYNKLVSSIPNLFYRPSNNQTPIQMTYPSISTGSNLVDQYSFVAGPFVIYGGKVTNPTNGQTVTLSPVTNIKYIGLTVTNYKFTGSGIPAALPVAIPTAPFANQFNISFQTQPAGVTFDIFYLVIGQP